VQVTEIEISVVIGAFLLPVAACVAPHFLSIGPAQWWTTVQAERDLAVLRLPVTQVVWKSHRPFKLSAGYKQRNYSKVFPETCRK
jgi:hypothetical protein